MVEETFIHYLISAKPTPDKTVLNLYAIEGYDHAEIEEMLQITESALRSQLSRARAFITNLYRQYNFYIGEKKKA